MLRFEIAHEDSPGPWLWRAGAWFSGRSWIRPFQSPVLSAALTAGANGITVAIREQRADGDFVEVSLGRHDPLTLIAGPAGVAPVYVATDGCRLVGSWDPVELAPFASVETLSPVVMARLLTHRHRYSAETLFSGITRVTAGATLTWSPTAGMALRYPAPASHVARPRRLRPGADPVAAFDALMDDAVREVCERHRGAVAVELSGGLDSANVAASVTRSAPQPVLSGGLLVAGATGPAQAARRRTIADHLGLRDIVVPTSAHLPLDPAGPRTPDRAHYPDTDVYLEAFDVLRAALRQAGAAVVFTGYGGDEIMSRAPGEGRQPAAPRAVPPWLDQRCRDTLADVDARCSPVTDVALPTLVVFAARHPAYLRSGVWPIAPFSTPTLSRFGRSLPVEWRAGKELLRRRLARIGLPPTVTHFRRPESFAATMRLALRRHAPALLADMLDRSVLIAQGYLRRNAVEDLRRRALDGRPIPLLVHDMIALDIGIRSMTAGKDSWCTSSTPTL